VTVSNKAMYEKLKQLIGDEPRPTLKVHTLHRHEVAKHYKEKLEKKEFSKGLHPVGVEKAKEAKEAEVHVDFTQNPVADVLQYPWCSIGICFAQNTKTGGENVGTGALVGENFIITASSLIDWVDNEWSMQFVPAYADGNAPYGVHNVVTAHSYVPASGSNPADGYMVCKLDSSVGNQAGTFGSWASPNGSDYQSYADQTVPYSAVGYPNQTVQIEADFTLSGTQARGGSMDLDTQPAFATGHWEGGPVWTAWNNLPDTNQLTPVLVAVIWGYEQSGSNVTQINEGGTDLVYLIFWAQDNYL
jgi:V8-like Glu-specific endopeptidase